MSKPTAIVLTHGLFDTIHAKTCHGLLRGTDRYDIIGAVDFKFAGKRTTDIFHNIQNVPIEATVDAYAKTGVMWCIVGVAFEGGAMPDAFRAQLVQAVKLGMSIVNGLHTLLNDDIDFMDIARRSRVEVVDIRYPKGANDLSFWTGRIKEVRAPRVAVLGTDCAIGKRTTCRFLLDQLRDDGVDTQMIYTGQTGWLQGYPYGCILDSTLNDFVSGELERAVLECDRSLQPELILIEGQSALRNPAGPCGSEIIISLQAKYVVLQHDPEKKCFEGTEQFGFLIPDIKSEIQLIRLLGAEVIAVTLKPSKDGTFRSDISSLSKELNTIVRWADEEGIKEVASLIRELVL